MQVMEPQPAPINGGPTSTTHNEKKDDSTENEETKEEVPSNGSAKKRSLSPGPEPVKKKRKVLEQICTFISPESDELEYCFTHVACFLDLKSQLTLSKVSKRVRGAVAKSPIWQTNFLHVGKSLAGHSGPVRVLCRLSNWLFSGGADGKIKAWDIDSGVCLRTLDWNSTSRGKLGAGVSGITAVEASGDSLYVGLGNGYISMQVLLKKPVSPQSHMSQIHRSKVTCLKICSDKLVSGGADYRVVISDARSLNLLSQLVVHRRPVTVLGEIRSSGVRRLYSGGADGNVFCYDLESLQCMGNFKKPEHKLFNPPAKPPNAGVLTSASGKADLFLSHDDEVSALCCYEDRVYTSGWDCTLKMWDANTFTCLGQIFLNPLSLCQTMSVRHVLHGKSHLCLSVREGELEFRSLEDLYLLNGGQVIGPSGPPSNFSKVREGHKSSILSTVCLDDGRIVSAGRDWQVKIWFVTGFHKLKPLKSKEEVATSRSS